MKKKTNKTMSFPNIISKITWLVLISAVLCMQTACNQSGGGLVAGGGIGGTGISIGEISGFGSVIVNDVHFDTQNAQVVVNGTPIGVGNAVVSDNLALGMVVRVEGEFLGTGTGKADRIVFNENVKGPVTAVETLDTEIKKITVLGQTVILDAGTKFKDTGFDSLRPGDLVQISGWTDGHGVIQATYVGIAEPAAEFTARGIVAEVNVNVWQKTLRINQLSVDFYQAKLRGFPDNEPPAAGQLIAASGKLDANGILVAKEISLENDLDVEDAEDVEIEGIVSHFSSPSNFDLGTTPVITDEETKFSGIAPEDIFNGLRLRIKGSLTEGSLLADEVIAKDKVNLEGTVESVVPALKEITLRGLDPLLIHVNDATKIFGDAAVFTFTDLHPDQHVKVTGYVAGENKVEAARVKVEEKVSDKEKDKVKLQGPVTFVAAPIIFVFSIDVNTDEIDGFDAALFDLVDIGDILTVNGKLSGANVNWKGIELLQE